VPDGDPFAFFQLQSRIIALVQLVSKNPVISPKHSLPGDIITSSSCKARPAAVHALSLQTRNSLVRAKAEKFWHPTQNFQIF
jgi:hypothetical protein